jgi:hypothetical protein
LPGADAIALVDGELDDAPRRFRADVHELLRLDFAGGRDDGFENAGLDDLGGDGQPGVLFVPEVGGRDRRTKEDDTQRDEDIPAVHLG